MELGAHLKRVTVVGDEMGEIGEVLRDALTRGADMIVFTGGLGPSEDDLTVDGKSIMGVMMLAAEHGSSVTVTADGCDEIDAMECLAAFLERDMEE